MERCRGQAAMVHADHVNSWWGVEPLIPLLKHTKYYYGKTLQIPAFFENLIPRPVGSFSSSGSSTLKRILFLIRFSVNPVFQSSILNFSCSKTAFFIHAYSRATFNRAEKINSRAAQKQHLIKKSLLVSSTIFHVFTSSTK